MSLFSTMVITLVEMVTEKWLEMKNGEELPGACHISPLNNYNDINNNGVKILTFKLPGACYISPLDGQQELLLLEG